MSSLSEATTQRCQAAITQKLREMLGEEGVEILTDYVWHMVTRPNTTKEHVSEELREFLPGQWLIATVGPIINEEVAANKNLAPVQSAVSAPQQQSQPQPPHPPRSTGGPGPSGPPPPRNSNFPQPSTVKKIKKRCAKFPNCSFGDDCKYIHPSEQCVNWPHCTYGDECFYIHPSVQCRYGVNCPNVACNYTHPEGWDKTQIGNRFNAYTGQFKNYTYTCSE